MALQAGGKLPVFRGYNSHYGAGLGNVLGGIMRKAIPLVAPMLRSVGKKLVKAGAHKLLGAIDATGPPTYHPPPPPPRRKKPLKRRVVGTRRSVKPRKRRKVDIFSTP